MRKTILIILAVLVCCPGYSWAWKEHRLMAYMASGHLTPSTQAFLDRYLDQNIFEYATWMDRYRDSPGYTQTNECHMIWVDADGTLPVKESGSGRALPLMKEAINILSNWQDYNDSTIYINIVYLIHLIPEMHTPGHFYLHEVEENHTALVKKMWAPFTFDGKKEKSYHYFWDQGVTKLYPDITMDEFVKKFDTWDEEKQAEVCQGTLDDWALDNISRIRQIYDWYVPSAPRTFMTEEHGWLIEEQARRAGYRLAKVLNDLFDKVEVTE